MVKELDDDISSKAMEELQWKIIAGQGPINSLWHAVAIIFSKCQAVLTQCLCSSKLIIIESRIIFTQFVNHWNTLASW